MRKCNLVSGLVLALALWFIPSTGEAQTCTVSCGGGVTLSCCLSSGSCTSFTSSIDCNGTTLSCAAIQAYNSCNTNCVNQRNYCGSAVCGGDKACYTEVCIPDYMDCRASCGSRPTTNIGC